MPRGRGRRERRNVPHGVAHIKSTFNNTIVTISDTNGDVIDTVNWDDLEDIQWISTNITEISIDELSRRMEIVGARSNVIGQTIVATLDDFNLERALEICGCRHISIKINKSLTDNSFTPNTTFPGNRNCEKISSNQRI